jgi:hypothetical protein
MKDLVDLTLDEIVNHPKEIILPDRSIVLVDAEDFKELSRYKWHLLNHGVRRYAKRYSTKKERELGYPIFIRMHRQIMKVIQYPGTGIDHRNGNGLDNQKSNLREATDQQNGANSIKKVTATSIYKGVCKHTVNNNWIAGIKFNYKRLHLGSFKTEVEAALAYNRKATELFGEFAQLNIII